MFLLRQALFAACEITNPGRCAILNTKNVRAGEGLFGYSHLYGDYAGGQAGCVRVPKVNVGPLPEHIQAGELKPEVIITHHISLDDAAKEDVKFREGARKLSQGSADSQRAVDTFSHRLNKSSYRGIYRA